MLKFLAEENIFRGVYIEPLSHLARFLLTHRYGGTYMDSDVIVLKNINDLGSNWFCIETEGMVANSVFNSNNHGVGKLITQQSIE